MTVDDQDPPNMVTISLEGDVDEETPTSMREGDHKNIGYKDDASLESQYHDEEDSFDFGSVSQKVKKRVTLSLSPPVVIDDISVVEHSVEMHHKQDYLGYEDPERTLSRRDSILTQSSNVTDLFQGLYSERECYCVICAGLLLTFNSGFINGACLTGLLTSAGDKKSVAGFTTSYSRSALFLADGDFQDFGTLVLCILSFGFGAFLSGFLTPDATPYRIEPTYGPTFLIGGGFLLASSLLAAFGDDNRYFFFFASAAIGIQNGISSIYTSNLIRSTGFTGTTTDMAVFVGQMARGNYINFWKFAILASLTASFWIGGFLSVYATQSLTCYSLLFNAALFLAIGAALVAFFVSELHISVRAALFGGWRWKTIDSVEKLQETAGESLDGSEGMGYDGLAKTDVFMQIYVKIEADNSGSIEEEELMNTLKAAGIKIKRKQNKTTKQQAHLHIESFF